MNKVLRIIIVALAGLGFWGAASISYIHWTGSESCPMLKVIPACYVVLAGYSLILLESLITWDRYFKLFLIGWTPVILLACLGVYGELSGTFQCPRTASGIPKCYFSAAFGAVIGGIRFRLYYAKDAS